MAPLARPSPFKRLPARVGVVAGRAFLPSPSLATANGRSPERSRASRAREAPVLVWCGRLHCTGGPLMVGGCWGAVKSPLQ